MRLALSQMGVSGFVAIVITMLAMVVLLLLRYSRIFRDFHRPNSAARVMTLPVSKAEKFASVIICDVVVFSALMVGAFLVLYYTLIPTMTISVTHSIYSDLMSFSSVPSSNYFQGNELFVQLANAVGTIWWICYFLMIAIMFRRYQFGIAIGFYVGWVILVILLAINGGMSTTSTTYADAQGVTVVTVDKGILFNLFNNSYFALSLNAATMMLFGWLSWRKFSKLQIKR